MVTENKLVLGYVPYGTGKHRPFDQVYQHSKLLNTFEDVAGCDAIVIWGGADISPSIYGQKAAQWTGADDVPSKRDIIEMEAIRTAIAEGVPIIGVCRGAQLVCAMSGGKLVQDVGNHACGQHAIITDAGEEYQTSSVHHQMMYPFDVKHHLIAWSKENRSSRYLGEEGPMPEMEGKVEPEIVYFPQTRALAIQGHPEFMPDTHPFVQYCNRLVQEYLL